MKFRFKIQDFQTEAVRSIVDIFKGQPYSDKVSYLRDVGKLIVPSGLQLSTDSLQQDYDLSDGFKNNEIIISNDRLFANIQNMQAQNNIKLSGSLVDHLGKCSLDVEMETGTGKTYVYLKTIFELNKHYGWSKFIVVVPSIAIREGAKKTFEITQEHFMEHYSKKMRFFIYNSKNLTEIDNFSSSAGINVMIINIQAFNARAADARRIYEPLDDFGSRKPIDVIAANRPILILDEPQKMGGDATQQSLKNFKPLFCLNYSATHSKNHNLVYVLDALDAYNKRLVKKIEVKGFEVNNLRGTDGYLYCESIILSPKNPPKARVEIEIQYKNEIKREIRILSVGDDLYSLSNNLEQYKGYRINDIDPILDKVTFTNGMFVKCGDVTGDVSEKNMRRIQIRETIVSHFEKEKQLFELGIKTISLFFIDEVAKYRVYDDAGNEKNSEYSDMFEQEYLSVLNGYIKLEDTPYKRYLQNIDVKSTHAGYFSIDKRGRKIDSTTKRGSDESDDITAYDLILKDKERLLSFEEPVRFIFSHSALREGWDNPNVFQICTLKHSDSATQKRQEVGRGLRLAVNQHGDRMDRDLCGERIHAINMLTVIASESYRQFVTDLQRNIKEELYDRPSKASKEYFYGKTIKGVESTYIIDDKVATQIHRYLIKNDYIDENDNVTQKYRTDMQNNNLAALNETLTPYEVGIHTLIQSVFDESMLNEMFVDGNQTKISKNPLNDNFFKKEFQALWNHINHQYAYTVEFNSQELIAKAIESINNELFVTRLQYTVTAGQQAIDLDEHALARGDSFSVEKTRTESLPYAEVSRIKYDLIGKISGGTKLTRKTIASILSGLYSHIFDCFKHNPEEFISKIVKLINEEKATMVVEHISYDKTDQKYDSTIFTAEKSDSYINKAFKAKKSIQDYVFTDGIAEKSIERQFAEDLDAASEVCVYAKLPLGFHIPTPVGNYSPDWAIAFNKGAVKHIFFIAETKGSMDSMQLRPIEQAKIACAKKLFNSISNGEVRYHDVDSYQSLLNIMGKL